ncbi:N-acyl-D-amino-acid deacylase [Halobacillus karajensis]|uniref:D-aminoacylase n=1 Tax=Halobacillus karajensis TaxID=195088 RepID=A0A024P6V0_9BACI|nr:D-aminoacylase [Halobacillus karajensis]CDQ18152.1 D-aminoacylase [Halobacillus karajensis]CDQ24503.1 D-aminoacylase [Halobacillus karajensis]CDQ29249.1 D-aminoacylase [Halobacillus karajensis]SEH58281.1 N-acyl-D-amino-acid deacylase [Halobacillus karajensis]
MLDTVIKNGKVVDGTGNPWFYGNVGIKEGRIVAVGPNISDDAKETIDIKGKIVSPGFIDGHCHSDLMILDFPESEIKLQQGVTTEVVGNCGLAPVPVNPLHKVALQTYVEPVLGKANKDWKWETISEYFNELDKSLISENVASYVAHGSLRIAVMGFDNRPPTKEEMEEMKYILEEGMKAGAIGLSIGLLYSPGSYSTKEELAELCQVVAKYNGVFSTHIRGEGNNLIPSIKEVIWIANKANVPLHISHLKAAGKRNWGKVIEAMEIIENARSNGMDVTCDVYPYSAGSTMLTTLLPPWSLEGGISSVLSKLKDPIERNRIKQELIHEQEGWDNLVASTGWDSVIVSSVNSINLKKYEGKSILEISQGNGKSPVDQAFDLLTEANGNIGIVFFHMDEKDIQQVMHYPNSLIASDSLTCYSGKPHPRLYGTFPRVFSKYVKQDKVLSIEEAIRKMTSFPAKRFGLGRRGLLTEGYAADLVVFDFEEITDKATYEFPEVYPEGIEYVFVNGKLTTKAKNHTSQKCGCFIKQSSSTIPVR